MENTTHINDLSSNHLHRTEIPNILFTLGLTPHQLAVYLTLKRIAGDQGQCTKSSQKIANEANVNMRTLQDAKKFLSQVHPKLGKPLIKIITRKTELGDNTTNLIKIIDIWPDNYKYFYSNYSPKQENNNEEIIEIIEGGGTCKSAGGVPAEMQGGYLQNCTTKKIPYKEDPLLISSSGSLIIPCARAEDPPDKPAAAAGEKIYFNGSSGALQHILRSDVYKHFLKINYPTEVVDQAINVFSKRKSTIGSPLKVLELIAHDINNSKPKVIEPKITESKPIQKKGRFDPSLYTKRGRELYEKSIQKHQI